MNNRGFKHRNEGFTLIELMITIVIVAILAGIALPAFNGHMKRTKRTAAQAEMMGIHNSQEQFLLANRSYVNKATLEASGFSLDDKVAADYTYDVTIGAGAAPTFLITFTPKAHQLSEGVMTLNEQSVGTPVDKWER